jgi:hypothetical protein
MRYFLKNPFGLLIVFLMALSGVELSAQQITRLEYFVNQDPGWGQATTVNITPSANISNLSVQVPLQQIPTGISTIGIRAFDGNAWGVTRLIYFLKSGPGLTPISRLEYFLNADPGFGMATTLAITPGMNLENLISQIDLQDVPLGLSRFGLRSFDGNAWSVTRLSYFLKSGSGNSPISRLEYFLDVDPGFGMATPLAITPGLNLENLVRQINLEAVPPGLSRFGLRSFDGNVWSVTRLSYILKLGSAATNITRVEYFFNEDPGFGQATSVPITPGENLVLLDFDAALQSLPFGMNFVGIRSFDGNRWSVTRQVFFVKNRVPAANINFAEYFIDDDPGFGNGTAISFTPSTEVADLTFQVNIENLPKSDHVFFIRSRDANGIWSLTNLLPFNNEGPLPVRFLNFTALLKNNNVQLEWQTATETNNRYFVVERASGQMGGFDSIGMVRGAGNSNTVQQYRYNDYKLQAGTLFRYRIRQVDNDGQFSYSAIRLINLSSLHTPIQIAPTVTRQTVWIDHAQQGALLGIYDTNGKQVSQYKLQGSRDRVSLTGLPRGIYFLVVHQNGRVMHHQKVLLE